MRRAFALMLMSALVFLTASQSDAQILHKKRKKANKSTSADNTAAPDKILYDRALNDIKHGKQEVGRLGMQTLINTYPDSEYLAKAKLGIADSFYKEGGTANLTQAIQGYKDFIIFFPFLPEAAYAQLQVANAHYQQMAKPDRDRSEAKLAEEEYQTFLAKYPKDPLADKAAQRLRDVQEIIAEGDYRIGRFYYVKGDRRAAAARLLSVNKRYPLFSKSDRVLWMLGDIFEKSEHKEVASIYYGQIIRNYPLSPLAPGAKNKLVGFKVPVPQPDPKAVAWMTAEQKAPRAHDSFYMKPLALLRAGPHDEKIASAKSGGPNLEPDVDNTSATDILSGGNKSQIGGGPAGSTAVVETVTPGTPAPAANGATEADRPAAESSSPNTPAADPNPATQPATETKPADPPAGDSSSTSQTPNASGSSTSDPGKSDSAEGSSQNGDGNKADAPRDSNQNSTDSKDSKDKKESSSKKKKGLRKVVPW